MILDMQALEHSFPSNKHQHYSANKLIKEYGESFNAKALVLLEHEEEVKEVLQRQRTDNPIWVAVGPGAMFELEQRQMPFTIPEDYYQLEDLNAIGKESLSRVQEICHIIDRLLGQSVNEVKELELTPTLFCFFILKITMDILAARIYQIKRLLTHIQPQSVTIHSSSSYPPAQFEIDFDNRESLYTRLLSLEGWGVDVNLLPEIIIPEAGTRQRTAIIKNIKSLAIKSDLLYDAAMKMRYFALRNPKWLVNYLTSKKGKPTVCIYGGSREWFSLLEHLARSGIRINFLLGKLSCSVKDIVGEKKQKQLLQELEENTSFRNLFTWQGIDTYPLLKGRIAFLVKDNVNQVISTYQAASKLFKRQNISAVLTSVKSKAIEHTVCLAAQHRNIPVFNWQHGPVGYYGFHTLEFLDLLTTDIYLAYGNGACQYLDKKAKKYQTTLKPVGSVSLDTLRRMQKTTHSSNLLQRLSKVKKDGKKICLYATCNYFQNTWSADTEPPPSDLLLYQTQWALVSELVTYSDLYLIFKLHPNPFYRQPPFVGYFQRNNSLLVVSNEYTFTDLLSYSDLIVLDYPTTVLVQAIAANKPVFVVMKHLHLFTEAWLMLQRRAVCADEPLELIEALKKYLATGIYPADLNDNSFLKAYGTFLDDGHSSERAVNELLKTISRKQD